MDLDLKARGNSLSKIVAVQKPIGRSKTLLDVQTKTIAASDLPYSEESLRALFLAALAHDLLTPLLF